MYWRDIFVTLVVLGSLPYCFRRPFAGLVMFSWLAYMRAQDLCWGFARYQRYSYFVAIAMIAGLFLFERKRLFVPDIRNQLLLILTALVTISTFTSRYGVGPVIFTNYTEFIKIIAVALITTALVDTQERLRILVWTVSLSLGFFGVKCGLWGLLTGGGRILRGPGGLMGDNNDFALALTMNLPFLFYLALSETEIWVRRGLFAAMGLTCITIVLTHSRGGFLAMCATLGLMTWRSRNRMLGFSLAILAVLLFLVAAPASVKERLGTLKKVDEDSSAQARLHTWGIAFKIIASNPILGVGFRNFQAAYPDYDPNPMMGRGQMGEKAVLVAHNSYLQMGAESGIPALATYFLLFGATFALLVRIRKLALRRYFSGWIANYVRMFEASLFGFMVGATFLNRAHFDFVYHVIAIATAFGAIALKELASTEKYPERASATAMASTKAGFSAATFRREGTPVSLGGAGEGRNAPARTALGATAARGGFASGTVAPPPKTGFRRSG